MVLELAPNILLGEPGEAGTHGKQAERVGSAWARVPDHTAVLRGGVNVGLRTYCTVIWFHSRKARSAT